MQLMPNEPMTKPQGRRIVAISTWTSKAAAEARYEVMVKAEIRVANEAFEKCCVLDTLEKPHRMVVAAY
jgi:hypothetical protein